MASTAVMTAELRTPEVVVDGAAQGTPKKRDLQEATHGFRAADWQFRGNPGTKEKQTYEVKPRSRLPAFPKTKMEWWWSKAEVGGLGDQSYQLHTTTSNPLLPKPRITLTPI